MRNIRKKLTLLMSLILLSSTIAFGQAKISIPENEFDFGIVPQHMTISHTFWIYSSGLDTLKITEIRPGCGCTKAPLEKNMLAPGDSAELEIIYSTKTYRDAQVKRPRITSNADNKLDMVMIKANVTMTPDSTYPIVISPYEIDLTHPIPKYKNNTYKSDFVISNVSDDEIKLNLIDYPSEMFKVKIPKKLKPGESKVCKLEVKKEFAETEFKKSITIELDDKKSTRFTIPVRRSKP